MISPEFKEVIEACAKQFKVKTVWLFGLVPPTLDGTNKAGNAANLSPVF